MFTVLCFYTRLSFASIKYTLHQCSKYKGEKGDSPTHRGEIKSRPSVIMNLNIFHTILSFNPSINESEISVQDFSLEFSGVWRPPYCIQMYAYSPQDDAISPISTYLRVLPIETTEASSESQLTHVKL